MKRGGWNAAASSFFKAADWQRQILYLLSGLFTAGAGFRAAVLAFAALAVRTAASTTLAGFAFARIAA